MTARALVALGLAAAAVVATPALATTKVSAGAVPRETVGPYGVRILVPASRQRCGTDGVKVRVAARWSRRAVDRPVRAVRVLLQRPGSEAVIDAVSFAPARPTTTRRATLRLSTCRANLDVRYELFVGREDVPHDHTSVVVRVHASRGA